MTPDKILRNLEHGYFMTHEEQDETAKYIRDLQESNRILQKGILMYVEEVVAMRRDLTEIRKQLDET
jgi:predicted  nucleic acid-binding Zn-ribbon protein